MGQVLTDAEMAKVSGVVQAAVRLLTATNLAARSARSDRKAIREAGEVCGAVVRFRLEILSCAPELFDMEAPQSGLSL